MAEPIRILISACLLGKRVRYDGGHKRDAFLVETLGKYVQWIPVCPEVESGLPAPREPMRLAGDPAAPRLLGAKSGIDHTERMARFARAKVRELESLNLCAYVCKKNSPSCSGIGRIKVSGDGSAPAKAGTGMFTKVFVERFPLVPVEEEGRLRDPAVRESFIERVFTLRRFRDLLAAGRTRERLVEFHTRHELLLLSHSRRLCVEMGRLVAHAKEMPAGALFGKYRALLLEALSARLTPKKYAGALSHAAGCLRRVLTAEEKRELQEAIARYGEGSTPLVVPLTLLKHHARRRGVSCLQGEVFLDPHPVELLLRNHA